VAKIYPELVVRGSKGEIESVQYRELIPLMLNEMQHQKAAMQDQQATLATLKAENASLEARLKEKEPWQAANGADLLWCRSLWEDWRPMHLR
jgi:hypothetical protein